MASGDGYKGSNMTEEQYDTLRDALESLAQAYENDEGLDPAEQNRLMVRELIRVTELLEAYGTEGNEELLQELLEESGLDGDTLDELMETIEDNANSLPDPTAVNSDFYTEVDLLKDIYADVENMDGLSPEEKIERYETFFNAYVDVLSPFVGREDYELIEKMVDRRIGVRPGGEFADMGAEYVEIKADQLKEKLEAAENYSMDDARAELMALSERTGEPMPDDNAIKAHYLAQKDALYDEAENHHHNTRGKVFLGDDDIERMEIQAGYNQDTIDRAREAIKNELVGVERSLERENAQATAKNAEISEKASTIAMAMNNADLYTMDTAAVDMQNLGIDEEIANDPELFAIAQEYMYIYNKREILEDALVDMELMQDKVDPETFREFSAESGHTIEEIKAEIDALDQQEEVLDEKAETIEEERGELLDTAKAVIKGGPSAEATALVADATNAKPAEISPEAATFTSLMDTAEDYTMQDAIAAAQAGNTDGATLSPLAIEANYISERTGLYTEAMEYYRGTESELGAQGMAEIENQSGYSLSDIENGIETMALQSGELQIRITSDAPELEDQPVNPVVPDNLEVAAVGNVRTDAGQIEQGESTIKLGGLGS